MYWLNDYRMRLMLVGFVAVIVLGGGSAKADFTFGEPTNLGPTVNTSFSEGQSSISADGLELYFQSGQSGQPGGYGDADLWVTKRLSREDSWGEPFNLGPLVNSAVKEGTPSISTDGLSLFFWSFLRPGGIGMSDLWVTTRTNRDSPWNSPVNLGPTINTSSNENAPDISADGLSLYFHSQRSGADPDLWEMKRISADSAWGDPMNLGPIVNSNEWEMNPTISADGLVLFFARDMDQGYGEKEIWVTTRQTSERMPEGY